jgi:hypothetical protein
MALGVKDLTVTNTTVAARTVEDRILTSNS